MKWLRRNIKVALLLFAGTLTWTLTMFKSGLVYQYGMGFWGPNGHDGIWHMALIESLSKGTLQMPVFAGENIKNYHIAFDMLLAVINRVTYIPVVNLYFQVIPPIMAFFVGLFVYKFVSLWKKSESQALWAVFFVYFSGSFGWIITLFRGGGFNGESLFWAQQSISTLINPPFALSLLIIFIALYVLAKNNFRHLNSKNVLLLSLLFGVLTQVKIYAGLLILPALFVSGIWDFVRRRDVSLIKIFFISTIFSFLILLPTFNFKSGGLIFQPFWFLENMVSNTDRLYWPKMASALYNYKLSGNFLKGTIAYSLVFILFLVGNMGIRIISFLYILKRIIKHKIFDIFEVIIMVIVFLGIAIPTIFIQTGNSWNAIQFFYYSLVFLSVLTGIVVGKCFEDLKSNKKFNKASVFLISVVFVFTIPTTVATLRHYLPGRPPAKIPNSELKALAYLRQLPDGVVLTIPISKPVQTVSNPPLPLYLYESTAYVSAMTGKTTFLDDVVNLDITGYAWKERLAEITKNMGNLEYFKNHGIDYIYVADVNDFTVKDEMKLLNIYNKDGIAIYKI